MKVHTIDLHFRGTPKGIAAYLVETPDGPILMETGPESCWQALSDGIARLGFEVKDIRHVFLTHIHLDHAGASWVFAEQGAKIYVHPFGYPHLLDPSKFLASAKRIYGDMMDELWGQIKPIAAAQLQMVDDQEIIEVAGLQIIGHHTPGHAKHHIAWQIKEHIFTGDVAGIAIEGGPVIPPCPPPDIHIQHWKESLARLRSIKEAEVFYLAHFGSVANLSSHLDELEQSLDNYAQFMLPFYENGKTIAETIPVFESFALQLLRDQEVNEEIIAAYKTANPADMSVAGLMRYWKKHGSS